jgi:hypothetical protein
LFSVFFVTAHCLKGQSVLGCYQLYGKVPRDITGGYFVNNTLQLYTDSTFVLAYRTYKTKSSKRRDFIDFFEEYKGTFKITNDTIYLTERENQSDLRFWVSKNKVVDITPFKDSPAESLKAFKLYKWRRCRIL